MSTPTDPLPRAARRRRPPLALLLPGLAALAFLGLPLLALLLRAPWSELIALVATGPVAQALWLSLRTAATATAISLVLGVPLAWLLARGRLPGGGVIRAVVTLPMVLPPVVGGVALLSLLGRRGLVGQHLETWFGFTIPFTTTAVVLAQTFVALPFLVLSVDGALRGLDRRFEDVSATLGASRWTTFRRVTLPMVAPAVGAGAVLCFARALGEFGATITFAGNFPGTTRTMPTAIYLAMEQSPDAAVALSIVLVVISAAVLILLRSRWLTAFGGTP
ncbi:molybdate ABC transporter permease subunit [Serinibacter arcticus]|uniref:Molybdenum transport system permease n=1 Tax=Serinibacter arcticus TaxID=1655435 RepID=A0A2U1ZWP0_9MICO|nr:ABC transporter permease [Serinibacter arcticus]PWD51406.1 molybdate ABC transporter permease subunit [Serinibacter arcticus]